MKNKFVPFVYQRIRENGIGLLNLDYFAVTLQNGERSTEEIFEEFRKNLSAIIFAGRNQRVYPLDSRNRDLWESDKPLGAILVFDLFNIGSANLDRGAVVVSCMSSQDFILSTITISGFSIGSHPVSGNRAFGAFQNKDGSTTIYVKAADRIARDVNFSSPSFAGITPRSVPAWRNYILKQGDAVWRHMQLNLVRRFRDLEAKSLPPVTKRIEY
ncbi:MAG: hypothetical protein ABJO27_19895 [Pseudoruegeria sp.]